MLQAQNHVEPPAGELPGDQVMIKVQARLRRINTAARWARRAAELIADLQAQLAAAMAQNHALRQEVDTWRRMAVARAGFESGMTPPQHYVDALRTAQPEPYRTVKVVIDGRVCKIGLRRHPAAKPDPVRELAEWLQEVATVRALRTDLAGES